MMKVVSQATKIKFLVTGAAGFIGSNLCEKLIEQGFEVCGLDNLSQGNLKNLSEILNNKRFRFMHFDLISDSYQKEMITPDVIVVHLAALADIVPSISNPQTYFENNVTGTLRLLEACRIFGVRKVIYAASASCYGDSPDVPTNELYPCNPKYPYALTKYLAEQLVTHWNQVYKIPTVSLRFFNVYGPRSRTNGQYGAVLGVFLAQKLANRKLTIVGDGKQSRDFIHVRDVCDAIIQAAITNIEQEIFNIGSGMPRTVLEFAGLISDNHEFIAKRPGEPDITQADISKANIMLNWFPKITLEKGLPELLVDLDAWSDAPVWDSKSIENETSEWFRMLGK